MSAEAFLTGPQSEPITGRKCRYCARVLGTMPAAMSDARVAVEHCDRPGCLWCAECHAGLTSVSPVRNA